MKSKEICKLCGGPGTRDSHVLPAFAVRWLKNNSIVKYLRGVEKPNKRVEDQPTSRLLCGECEQRFSKWETSFSKKVFIPFHENQQYNFEYGKWLIRFIVSLSWRGAVIGRDEFVHKHPYHAEALDKAIKCWAAFLLGQSQRTNPYEHHIFLFTLVESVGSEVKLPSKFHAYTLRGLDSCIVSSRSRLYVYSLIPGIAFCSGITPPRMTGWKGSRISHKGQVRMPIKVSDDKFGEFLIDRANIFSNTTKLISAKQQAKINETVEAALEGVTNKEKLLTMLLPHLADEHFAESDE